MVAKQKKGKYRIYIFKMRVKNIYFERRSVNHMKINIDNDNYVRIK